jgi:ABC-2 type transport system ATP-binding protein
MVTAEHITKEYNRTTVLKDLSFHINKSELFGFIGPDGAGKTTLFRILTSLILPSSGFVKISGLDVIRDYKRIRKITGYMPGRFSLYSDLSVEENLNFFASVFNTSIEENFDLIRDIYVQIEPFKTRLAGRLSGGMKQKLALSCALIHKPEILVLDEPTTGVDAVSRKEFWEMLKSLKEKGITILVSTPYMDEASLCDRVALIQDGKILAVDSPDRITDNYTKTIYSVQSEHIYQLLGDIREFKGEHHAFAFGQDIHYTDNNPDFQPDELIHYLKDKGHAKLQVRKIKPDIEDVFIDLMQSS